MKLIRLSANKSSFRTIDFNPKGLTLILGSSPKSNNGNNSSNGVGKTLALSLVHHCLGAKSVSTTFREKLSGWVFSLEFELNGVQHKVERDAEGKDIHLNGEKLGLKSYQDWLNSCDAFHLSEKQANLTFRSLFSRFARHALEDCQHPTKTNKEPDVEAQLRTFFLLGLDYHLIINKKIHKQRLDGLKTTLKNWETDPTLHEMFLAGNKPKLRLEWLENEIPRAESNLEQFSIAEDYLSLEQGANQLTQQLRETERQISINKFQLEGIEKSLKQQPDISYAELLNLYEGLQATFKPEVLAHFEAVETFHQTFLANRRRRLEADKQQIVNNIKQLETEREKLGKSRDECLKDLQGKRALDEYTALSNHLAKLKAERDKLREYLSFADNRKSEIQALKETMLQEENQASEYVKTEPVADYSRFFQSIATQLYPKASSGIILENNTGENQLRYELSVQIDGDNSDGINSARILCFDWLLLTQGRNHHMDFLWHDNRLFAHIDPNPRATWFKFISEQLKNSDRQYIATMNIENYQAMLSEFSDSQRQDMEDSIKLTLQDDRPENKLLGIQFG